MDIGLFEFGGNVMPDHYKEILLNAPMAYFGMIVGRADMIKE